MNPSKALGPDELYPRVLKELASKLGPVFAHLFQSLLTRVKSQKNGLLQIYVPFIKRVTELSRVIMTCVPCKLLEHIVCSNIMAHLDECKLLSDRQHAFRKRHSCETQLTTVINDWAKILDNGGQVDTFILDFEKAFDTPPHHDLPKRTYENTYGIQCIPKRTGTDQLIPKRTSVGTRKGRVGYDRNDPNKIMYVFFGR